MKNLSKAKMLILDANIWIYGLLGTNKEATDTILKCIKGEYKIIVNSYIVAEVSKALKRIAIRIRRDPLELEKLLWKILNSDNAIKDFHHPVAEDLIEITKKSTEILMISQILKTEPKDIPYLTLAFKHKIPIITTDERSLAKNKENIKKMIGINILSLKDFCIK